MRFRFSSKAPVGLQQTVGHHQPESSLRLQPLYFLKDREHAKILGENRPAKKMNWKSQC